MLNTPLNPIAQSINQETSRVIRIRLVQIFALVAILRHLFPGVAYDLLIEQTPIANTLLNGLVVIALFVFWFVLATLDRVEVASSGLIVTLILLTLTPNSLEQFIPFIAVVAVSTLVQDWRRFSVLNTLLFGITTWQIANRIVVQPTFAAALNPMGLVVAMATASLTIRYFVNSIQETLVVSESNANLLRIAAEVGELTVGIVSLEALLPQAVDFIRDRFGYYHVQIFLVDDGDEVAWLRASTGEVGQQLLARNHHLDVGSNSVVGRVTKTGATIIAHASDYGHARNELLPNTRVELALPLRDGDRVIGVLDVQSTRDDAFPVGDQQALQIMSSLLAASIRNALSFEEQKRNVQENQRLLIEAKSNLREIQRLNRNLTRNSWSRFTEGSMSGIAFDGDSAKKINEWSELSGEAAKRRQPLTRKNDDYYVVAVPIILNGEVIGVIEVETDAEVDEIDTREIAHAVSNRLAISIDNARLFEETRDTTLYEQQVNRIVSKYQNLDTVNELLQVTLQELSETLGAESSAIRLSSAELIETPEDIIAPYEESGGTS